MCGQIRVFLGIVLAALLSGCATGEMATLPEKERPVERMDCSELKSFLRFELVDGGWPGSPNYSLMSGKQEVLWGWFWRNVDELPPSDGFRLAQEKAFPRRSIRRLPNIPYIAGRLGGEIEARIEGGDKIEVIDCILEKKTLRFTVKYRKYINPDRIEGAELRAYFLFPVGKLPASTETFEIHFKKVFHYSADEPPAPERPLFWPLEDVKVRLDSIEWKQEDIRRYWDNVVEESRRQWNKGNKI